jgi:acetyl esterase/lipase
LNLKWQRHETIKLWAAQELPYAGQKAARDVPALQVIRPAPGIAKRAAVVVLPGGGYANLAPHEGLPVGKWLAGGGYTAFILAYRGGLAYPYPVPLTDARRAIRLVRSRAADWDLKADRIGILGFSAGGHLASTVATHITEPNPQAADPVERVSARPDFQILIYPVITMQPGGHEGSRLNLLGSEPSPELIECLSNENHLTARTPPAFIFHSTLDQTVPVENSDKYAAGLKTAGIPYKYVRGEYGSHGIGLHESWTGECLSWLEGRWQKVTTAE